MHSKTEEENTQQYTGTGFLIVNVVSANEALPIKDAQIYIRGNDEQNKNEFFELTTDESGLTKVLSLKTPPKELSLTPGNPAGYSSYNIYVNVPDYYPREFTSIPIFDGVTSLQRINLVAKAPFQSDEFNPNQPNAESAPFEDTAEQ